MRTEDFDYHLPPELIAQRPANPRDSSRLMILDRSNQEITHSEFRKLPTFLKAGDGLVLNETQVIPARLHGRKIPGGGKIEVLLLKRVGNQTWEAMVGGKGLIPGKMIAINSGPQATILEDLGRSKRLIQFEQPISPDLDHMGEMPLPPYIQAPLMHPGEYQTVFARKRGSVAAPTAGLHFTSEILEKMSTLGVQIARVTLHVGLDTFAPVHEENPDDHKIHSEWCQVTPETAQSINAVHRNGGRIISVGTTSTRTLETAARQANQPGLIAAYEGATELYILPGHTFKAVDAILTNFHLPRSTLLMMISAFAGEEFVRRAYAEAIRQSYRFYSFGDAMLIL
jgi:S-adenosylmethionine:tRNA ribosyltransferase-isomerase